MRVHYGSLERPSLMSKAETLCGRAPFGIVTMKPEEVTCRTCLKKLAQQRAERLIEEACHG